MALTYEQSNKLMNDFEFRGKIKVACVKYSDAVSIRTEPVSTRTALVKWAFACAQGPDAIAQNLQPYVVEDAAVQDAGVDEAGKSLITDAALQGSVEATVNKQNS